MSKKYLNYASRHRSSKIFLILVENITSVLKKLELLHWFQHNLLQITIIAVNFTANTPNIPLIFYCEYTEYSPDIHYTTEAALTLLLLSYSV